MYGRILVPIDGSPTASAGLGEAIALAAAYRGELCLLHVIDDVPVLDDLSASSEAGAHLRRQRARGQALLEEAKTMCAASGQAVQTHLHELGDGTVAQGIVAQARALDCGLIVIGSHGRRGLRRAVMGSDAEAVLRESPMPVVVVRVAADAAQALPPEVRVPYRRLLVPVDGSETSMRGLDEAIRLARNADGRVRLLHVIDELSMAVALNPALSVGMDWTEMLRMGGSTVLRQAAERTRAAGIETDTVLVDDFKRRLCDVVAHDANDWLADVIVLGSHGRRGFDRALIGSDAEQILRRAPVPVMLVPSALRSVAHRLSP